MQIRSWVLSTGISKTWAITTKLLKHNLLKHKIMFLLHTNQELKPCTALAYLVRFFLMLYHILSPFSFLFKFLILKIRSNTSLSCFNHLKKIVY